MTLSCSFLVLLSFLFFLPTSLQDPATNYIKDLYDVALSELPDVRNTSLVSLHLIRVPKASSTALSMIARRLTGCDPPGPCCKFPGDPVGSCPDRRLFNCETLGKVVGCTHHRPFIKLLYTQPEMPTITMLRNPILRSLSAFSYRGIHCNSKCTSGLDHCFHQYTNSSGR